MSDRKGFIQEFKEFIATGNMVELAVAVILGASVTVVIKAFTDSILMQVVAAIFGEGNFDDVTITLRENVGTTANPDGTVTQVDSVLRIGTFINALISLVATGLVLFIVIRSYNRLKARQKAKAGVDEGQTTPTEIELLIEIRDALKARS